MNRGWIYPPGACAVERPTYRNCEWHPTTTVTLCGGKLNAHNLWYIHTKTSYTYSYSDKEEPESHRPLPSNSSVNLLPMHPSQLTVPKQIQAYPAKLTSPSYRMNKPKGTEKKKRKKNKSDGPSYMYIERGIRRQHRQKKKCRECVSSDIPHNRWPFESQASKLRCSRHAPRQNSPSRRPPSPYVHIQHGAPHQASKPRTQAHRPFV
jgi:hypothetical protein